MTWTTVHLVATIIVSAAFLASGVLKLRATESTRDTIRALGLPPVLQRDGVARAYPIMEIALGGGLLILPAPLWWLASLAGVLLMTLLTFLVVRVIRSGDAVACNCFGSTQPITGRTVVRNSILSVLALLTVIADPATTAPIPDAIRSRPDVLFAVVLATVVSAGVTTAILAGPTRPRDVETYEDRPLVLPDLLLRTGSGSPLPLPSLTADGAVLLINVKSGCGPCTAVIEAFSDGDLIGDRVTVRVMERTPVNGIAPDSARLWDDDGEVARVLGLAATPSALLLAADGTTPADPVRGSDQIFDLVRGIEEAVAALRPRGLDDVDL
jgi:hypothetical protein